MVAELLLLPECEVSADESNVSCNGLNELDKRWDKLKEWSEVLEEVTHHLHHPENFDHSITIEHGPQLLHTMRHSCNILCFTQFSTNSLEVFSTHYSRGSVSYICVWNLKTLEISTTCVQEKFPVPAVMSRMTFILKYRVYVTFSPDMYLRVFTEAKSGCQQVSYGISSKPVLCLTFNQDTNELIAGCVGTVDTWKLGGAEHSATLQKGRRFNFRLDKSDWVVDVQVDTKNKRLLAVCESALLVLQYEKNIQTYCLKNRHRGSMKCCCVYNHGEYLVTGGGNGTIKVWNSAVFTHVHEFCGHHAAITALQTHRSDPLLFSSSMDGSVQIWRMDNFQRFMRLDLAESVYTIRILGDARLLCQTEKELKMYHLNQFFSLFAPVESTVFHMHRMKGWMNKPSKILASCEDGSVRLLSPITGYTISIIYPMPTFQVLTSFVYNMVDDFLYTLYGNGEVLVFKASCNPCQSVRILSPEMDSMWVLHLALVHVVICDTPEAMVFGGLRNGQIALLDAKHWRMPVPLQAHQGIMACLEVCKDLDHNALGLDDDHVYLISGGTDFCMRLWRLDVLDYDERIVHLCLVQHFDFGRPPAMLVLSGDVLCTTFASSCVLKMYKITKQTRRDKMDCPFDLKAMYHTSDYDHTAEITAIDQCSALQMFATASADGTVKIWDFENTLIREINFGIPLNGMCFANSRGDILIGFKSHIISVPIMSYLPWDRMEMISALSFKDEAREVPMSYNHKTNPWFDPRQVVRHHLQLERRLLAGSNARTVDIVTQQLLESKGQMFVMGEAGRFETIGGVVQIVLAEDAEFNESIRRRSILHRRGGQGSELISNELKLLKEAMSKDKESSQLKMIGEDLEEDEGIGEDMQPSSEIQIFDPSVGLTVWEKHLMARKPIVAPDGFIPNSVVRKLMLVAKPVTPESPKPWQPKPIPKFNLSHFPPGWEPKIKYHEEEVNYEIDRLSDSSVESGRQFVWVDEDEEVMSKPESPLPDRASKSPPASTSLPKVAALKEDVLTEYTLKSPVFKRPDFDREEMKHEVAQKEKKVQKVEPVGGKKKKVESSTVETRKPAPVELVAQASGSVEKKGKQKKTDMVVDIELLKRLFGEPWFPPNTPYAVDGAGQKLLEMLEKFGKNHPVHGSICHYIVSFHEEIGLSGSLRKRFQEKLMEQLEIDVNGIRTNAVRTLRELGMDTNEIITALLPKIVDPARDVRQEAVFCLVELTDVKTKEELADLLDKLGVTEPIQTTGRQDQAMGILVDKIGLSKKQSEVVLDSYQDWVTDWVGISIPGVFEGEEYTPSMEHMMTGGSRKVKIVSTDSDEEPESPRERKRRMSMSKRKKSLSKRRPSKALKTGGKTLREEKQVDTDQAPPVPPVVADEQKENRKPSIEFPKQRKSKPDRSKLNEKDRMQQTTQGKFYPEKSFDRKLTNTPMQGNVPYTKQNVVMDTKKGSRSLGPILLRIESRFRPVGSNRKRYTPKKITEEQDFEEVVPKHRVISDRLREYAKMAFERDSDLHSVSLSADSDSRDIVIPVQHPQADHAQVGPEEVATGGYFQGKPGKMAELELGKDTQVTPGGYTQEDFGGEYAPGMAVEYGQGGPGQYTQGKLDEQGRPSDYDQGRPGEYGQKKPGEYGQGRPGEYGQETAGEYDQRRPGEYGQETAGEYGQRRPGEYDQGTAGEYGQRRPGEYGQGRHSEYGQRTDGVYDQRTAGEYVQRRPGEYGQGRPGEYAQGRPGEYAQGRPGEYAQGRPGEYAQGRPGEYAQGRPGEYAQGRPGEYGQGRPGEYGKGRPGEFGQGRPGEYAQGRPGEYGQGRPGEYGQGRPGEYAQGRSGEYGQGRPGEYGQGRPGEYGQGRPGEYGQGRPSEYGQGIPGEYSQGRPGEYGQGRPGEYDQGRPSEYTQGRPGEYGQGRPGEYGQAVPGEYNQARPSEFSEVRSGDYSHAHPGVYSQVMSENYSQVIPPEDSQIMSSDYSQVMSANESQIIPAHYSHQTEVHSGEETSLYDSGISRDISDSSSHGGRMGPAASYKKRVRRSQLSPVKSAANTPTPKKDEDWKAFLDSPTAVERKRMEYVKKDFEEGNMKRLSSLPPISYVRSTVPTLPGEAGLRLLQTVRVANRGKDKRDSERHKVEAVPGRLGVHTRSMNSGHSNFGVLEMQWTTKVPVLPAPDGSSHKTRSSHMRSHDQSLNLPPLEKSTYLWNRAQYPIGDPVDTTRFPVIQTAFSKDYEWEKPMTPPPLTRSRTVISPVRRVAEKHMCQQYRLAKKKLHHYISDMSPRPSMSRLFPQIKLASDHKPHIPRQPLNLKMLLDCIKIKT